jgi:DNA repair protein RadC
LAQNTGSGARLGYDLSGASLAPASIEFERFRIELPAASTNPNAFEWPTATAVLSNYLGAAGVRNPSLAARALLKEFGTLADLLAASRPRLRRAAGARLADLIEASRRLVKANLLQQVRQGPLLSRSPQLIELLQLEIGFLRHEQLIALYVDQAFRLMRIQKVGDGSIGTAPVNARKIIGCGLGVGATGFVLVHNHPSGDPQPSNADIAATSRLRQLGREVELHLLDHLIVARGRVESIDDVFRESRWVDPRNVY